MTATDNVPRDVMFAVELIDPISHARVSRGVDVSADRFTSLRQITTGGRFVWLQRMGGNDGSETPWPVVVKVKPKKGTPFEAHEEPPWQPPGTAPRDRLLRITLRPTMAYPFDTGVTAIGGRLLEGPQATSRPIENAYVQLAWREQRKESQPERWHPAPPKVDDDGAAPLRVGDGLTNERGEFLVFLRLPVPKKDEAQPDIQDGLLLARLQFTRLDDGAPKTRVTPNAFRFLDEKRPAGRVPEGRLTTRDVTCFWTSLQ
jgi:hypothetical protein